MIRLSLAGVVLGLVASSTVASAGTYLGLGIGSSASIGGDLSTMQGNGRSGRLILGERFGRLAIEATGTRYGTIAKDKASYQGNQLAASLKLNLPLGNNFEAFAGLGIERTWLSTSSKDPDLSGNGYLLGAGFAYHLSLGIAGGSIFVDYTYADTSLDATQPTQTKSRDATAGMWTLGLTLGI